MTSFHVAAMCGDAAILKILFDEIQNTKDDSLAGARIHSNPHAFDEIWGTVLCAAVGSGNLDCVKLLVDHDFDINEPGTQGMTPLFNAVAGKDLDIIDYLLEHGGDTQKADDDGRLPLHIAIGHGRTDIVERLLKKGGDINEIPKHGVPALHLAVLSGQFEVTKVLVEAGADVDVTDNDDYTILDRCVQTTTGDKYDEAVTYLLQKGAQPYGPFIRSVLDGDVKNVRLVSPFVDTLMVRMEDEESLLHAVVDGGNREVVDLLIERMKQLSDDPARHAEFLNAVNVHNVAPLHRAANSGDLDMIEALADAGADLNLEIEENITPLYLAIAAKQMDAVSLLIQKGADWAKTAAFLGVDPDEMARNMQNLDLAADDLEVQPSSSSGEIEVVSDEQEGLSLSTPPSTAGVEKPALLMSEPKHGDEQTDHANSSSIGQETHLPT